VPVVRLDDYLERHGIERVGFVKMDVEGAELEVLKGAKRFFERTPRPVILCEVDDYRTRPWDYPARAIIEFLGRLNYQWFGLGDEGGLVPLDQRNSYNLVAIPKEKIAGSLM
jgi:hypothetical protein